MSSPSPPEPSSPSSPTEPPAEQSQVQQQQEIDEPVTMYQNSQFHPQIHETTNQTDPAAESDPNMVPLPQAALIQQDAQSEVQENPETPRPEKSIPPITEPHVAVSDGTLTTPTHNSHRRGLNKRKKGKLYFKKQQAIEIKLQCLMKKLNPIAFVPPKILDFSKHETVFKKLGLWEFVHIEFDTDVRVDLIAQLVASYDSKLRSSYVNEFRIAVNRADLARAFKLPVKKEKGSMGWVDGGDLDSEHILDESTGFILEFVSGWVLLHEDAWCMPDEVLNWMTMIKDGHPEKVDWAGLFWFMMEKELNQGEQLEDCYYASHFQHLIKSHREEALLPVEEESAAEKVEELDAEGKEVEDGTREEDVKVGVVCETQGVEGSVMEGPSIELTLGQDADEEEEEAKDREMMGVNKREDDEAEEQGQWLLDGKSDVGKHFIERCSMEEAQGFGTLEDKKEDEGEMDVEKGEEVEEEAGEGLGDLPTVAALQGDGLTGNLLHTMEQNLIAFGSQEQLPDHATVDLQANMQQMDSAPPFFNNTGKRVLERDNDIPHHLISDSNKRVRINDTWDDKPVHFGTCMDQMQQLMERARMMYEEKEQGMEHLSINQQILLSELQERDNAIEHLQKTKMEMIQKREREIYRYERELYLMGSVLDGYRKALKETHKAFAEYRQRAQLPEEPMYKDAGPGGLMLSTAEIERLRAKEEEEYRLNCMILEQKAKEAEDGCMTQFEVYHEKINLLDKKLARLEIETKELTDCYGKRKSPKTEVSEPPFIE